MVLTPVDGWTIARLRYENPLTVQGRIVAVPTDRPAVFGQVLADHEIHVERQSAWLRIATVTLSLGMIPVLAALIWPKYVFSGPVLVLLGGICIWIATRPLDV